MRSVPRRGVIFPEPKTLHEQAAENRRFDERLRRLESSMDLQAAGGIPEYGKSGWKGLEERVSLMSWNGTAWELASGDTYYPGEGNWKVFVNGNRWLASRVTEAGDTTVAIVDAEGAAIPTDSEVVMEYKLT